jgi:DNA polymerase
MDRLGSGVSLHEKVSSLAREDLTGMKVFLEAKGEERHLSLASVDSSILQCTKCGLRNHCLEFGPTLPEGFDDVEIMVVGRNPGYDELIGGKPFIGRAGKRLDKFLEDVGLTRRDCWITNVNKCYSENNRPPMMGEILACSSYLRSEIDLVKPKFIMVFGNEAMAMLTPYGYSGVTKHCGEILEKPTGILGVVNAWVAICVHPSMALRSQSGELHMEYAANQVKKFLDER